MPSVAVDAVSPERAALRGPACLLDAADREALPGESGDDFGVVSLVRDEGWGLSTGALAAVLAVAGCGARARSEPVCSTRTIPSRPRPC